MASLIQAAIKLAKKVHNGQYRKGCKIPYFIHPQRVAHLVLASGGTEDEIVLAYLHDTIEDYPGDPKIIKKEINSIFGRRILNTVLLLTKPKSPNYLNYIKKIKRNKSALLIKLCDMVDNLSDDPSEKQKIKYLLALLEIAR